MKNGVRVSSYWPQPRHFTAYSRCWPRSVVDSASTAALICLIVSLQLMPGCSRAPQPTPAQKSHTAASFKATWAYWQSLATVGRQLGNEINAAMSAGDGPRPKTRQERVVAFEQAARFCRQVSDSLSRIENEVNSLSVLNVDSEALHVGAKMLDVVREVSSKISESEVLFVEGATLYREAQTWATWLEFTFVDSTRITKWEEDWLSRTKTLSEKFSAASRDGDSLSKQIREARIILSGRYGKDFPGFNVLLSGKSED